MVIDYSEILARPRCRSGGRVGRRGLRQKRPMICTVDASKVCSAVSNGKSFVVRVNANRTPTFGTKNQVAASSIAVFS